MAATSSNMLALGTKAFDFNLLNPVNGKFTSLEDIKSDKGTVIAFVCNHCPYVLHINSKFVEIANKYIDLGVSFVAISSNDVINYPDDSPENMIKIAAKEGYNFPYLFDETQEIAKSYQAACTPDFYVFDSDMKLAYRGQFDDSRPNNGVDVTGIDLTAAIEAILIGAEVNPNQKASIGCNIKWKQSRK
jgi:thiol-disulfide isomerase/thioredoxin